MPETAIRVKAVNRQPSRRGGTRYEVLEHRTEGVARLFYTWDSRVAQLCERAQSAVWVSWMDRPWGLHLTYAKQLDTGVYAFERQLEADRV